MSTVPSTRNQSGKIEHVHAGNFDRAVLRSNVPVLVDFYAPWCGPCKALAPLLEEVARENPAAKIVKVNVEEAPELANQYQVEAVPTLLVFKDGRLAAQRSGLADKASLVRMITR